MGRAIGVLWAAVPLIVVSCECCGGTLNDDRSASPENSRFRGLNFIFVIMRTHRLRFTYVEHFLPVKFLIVAYVSETFFAVVLWITKVYFSFLGDENGENQSGLHSYGCRSYGKRKVRALPANLSAEIHSGRLLNVGLIKLQKYIVNVISSTNYAQFILTDLFHSVDCGP
ncbi:hypothetical protein R1sor_015432 [Riccia sorocarpa]|uniref:Secreted protein n=1 Tax=Riccia sorocarpa TaxID=122646 RepID=A0ABD3HCM6_9MARC